MLSKQSMHAGALQFRTRKTGSRDWCPPPPEAVAALDESVSKNPEYYFWYGQQSPQSAVKIWERTFVRLFDNADINSVKVVEKRARDLSLA